MINSKQRSKLRAMAHHLKPIVVIGKAGIIDGAINSISRALDDHELIKVKLGHDKKIKNQFVDIVKNKLSALLIGNVGHTFIIFRLQEDKDKRKINI
mgnify:CR=1 FL=1|jgi:RNA-binding protein|tara:strand:- start:951 stop:1241 length:291 start_codon:yes stop_codon:yes gene_type:complete